MPTTDKGATERRTPACTIPLALLLTGVLLLTSACADAAPPRTHDSAPMAVRGEAVDVHTLPMISVAELESLAALAGIDETPRYGLDVHRIRYGTIDAHGRPTIATGTLLLPTGVEGDVPVLSVQHGTQTRRLAVDELNPEMLGPGLLFGAQGWAVVGADYLGLGQDSGVHPYYHAPSAASATADLLRAARAVIADAGSRMGDELFLIGYSQGAHVTMALHQALEADTTTVPVSGSVAMAGAFDLAGINVPHAVSDPAASTPLYLTYAVLGLNPVHQFADDLDDVFTTPYEDAAAELFDGTRDPTAITARLPRDLDDLFDPAFLTQLRRGTGPFFDALRANSVTEFTPRAPVLLVHARGDRDVPIESSRDFHTRLTAAGADVELVELAADLTHETAAAPAFLAARDWIDALRRG